MTIKQIPIGAEFYVFIGQFAAYLQVAVDGHKRAVAGDNNVALSNFATACNNWQDDNIRNRDMKLPLTPKPVCVPLRAVNTVSVTGQATLPTDDSKTMEVKVAEGTDMVAGIYMWDGTSDTPVCPDLPAPTPTHTGVSLMQQITDEGAAAKPGSPTIPGDMKLMQTATASNGWQIARLA